MADPSDVNNEDISPATSVSGDNMETKNANNRSRSMKRNRANLISSSADNSEESEPNEKRPAFRLQPPTLIHGQAKPIPKSDDEKNENTSKCKFLQPPKLSAPSSSSAAATGGKNDAKIGSGPLVSSSNPFLNMANKSATEEPHESEAKAESDKANNSEVVFGSNLESRVKMNGNAPCDDTQPDSTTDVESKDESKSGNLFLQTAAGSAIDSDAGPSGGFVFGSKMEDRVAINNEAKSPGKDSGDGAPSSSGFVFGQNLSERAKVSSSTDSAPSLFLQGSNSADSSANPVDSSLEESANSPSSSSNPEKKPSHGLKEDAEAHFLASQTKPVMPEVAVVTGEENEKNVLQVQCKLHQFESDTQVWVERAVGSLHLNDGKLSDDDLNFQSRLVMRAHGSLRLVLNTKVWAQMTVEQASKKSVRITAQTDDGGIGVFLITGTINDAEQIFRALEYRILHQKQLEERRKVIEDTTQEKSDQDPSCDSGNAAEADAAENDNPSSSQEPHQTVSEKTEHQPPADSSEQSRRSDKARPSLVKGQTALSRLARDVIARRSTACTVPYIADSRIGHFYCCFNVLQH